VSFSLVNTTFHLKYYFIPITEVEGNINSAKCVDILDNNRLQVILKFENHQWIFQDDSAPGTPVRTDKIVER
jgi:hypothetical protein